MIIIIINCPSSEAYLKEFKVLEMAKHSIWIQQREKFLDK